MELSQHVDKYLMARLEYDEAHLLSQKAHKELKQIEADFIDGMLNAQVKTFKHLESGETFGISEHFGISVTQNNTDAVRAWLVDEDGDDAPYLTEVCDKKSVTTFVRGLVETNRKEGRGDEDGIPDFLKLKTRPILSHRDKK